MSWRPSDLQNQFASRKQEVQIFQELIDLMEASYAAGTSSTLSMPLKSNHIASLRASQYLHLYNLIELTMTGCLRLAVSAPSRRKTSRFDNLQPSIQRLIINSEMGELSAEDSVNGRIHNIIDRILDRAPVRDYSLEPNKKIGNWSHNNIRKVGESFGIYTQFPKHISQSLQINPISSITEKRNALAHGEKSFIEIGSGVSSSDLADIVEFTYEYLEALVDSYVEFWQEHRYLKGAQRGSQTQYHSN